MLRSAFITLSEVKLHYLEAGEGPLLLLLHGFPEYSGIWTNYLARLSDRYHVVAPDLRGYHLSEKPDGPEAYDLKRLMGDIRELLAALGEKKVYLAGHDWGGLLAWYLAAHHPELFERLVILNAPHPKLYQKLYAEDAAQRAQAAYIPLLLSPESETFLAQDDYAYLRRSVFKGVQCGLSEDDKAGLLEAWRSGLRGPIHYYRSYIPQQKAYAAEMPLVTLPTLVLWGEKDHALSLKNLEGLDAFVSDLTIERFPEAGHWLTYEIPDAIEASIRSFCV